MHYANNRTEAVASNLFKGAEAIAIWYTIIEIAKANGLDPYHYLKYLLTEFPYYQRDKRGSEELLPWNVSGEDVVRLG